MGQSKIFVDEEADHYYQRNKFHRNFIADYLLSLFPKKDFATYDIAEFGIGGGQNLMLWKNYCNRAHGYDASNEGIQCFQSFYEASPEKEAYYAERVNLCESFLTPIQYDLIVYGFFAYYVADSELIAVRENMLKALKPGGYVFVHDFLARENTMYPDAHNEKLLVHKRNLPFWLEHFENFDLVHFRTIDNGTVQDDRYRNEFHTVDTHLTENDMDWNITALFRRRSA